MEQKELESPSFLVNLRFVDRNPSFSGSITGVLI